MANWIEPDIVCEMINKDDIVFEPINGDQWRGPNVRIDKFKGSGCFKRGCV